MQKILPSKISKMKKRLSKNLFIKDNVVILIVFLLFVAIYSMRLVNLTWNYQKISFLIPLKNIPFAENSNETQYASNLKIDANTTMIFLGENKLYLGTVFDFSKAYRSATNKYFIKYTKRDFPQILKKISYWEENIHKVKSPIAVIVPSLDTNVEFILQFSNFLKKQQYQALVFGTGVFSG